MLPHGTVADITPVWSPGLIPTNGCASGWWWYLMGQWQTSPGFDPWGWSPGLIPWFDPWFDPQFWSPGLISKFDPYKWLWEWLMIVPHGTVTDITWVWSHSLIPGLISGLIPGFDPWVWSLVWSLVWSTSLIPWFVPRVWSPQMVVRVVDDATSWDSDRHHLGLIPWFDHRVWSPSLIPTNGCESGWWCYLMEQWQTSPGFDPPGLIPGLIPRFDPRVWSLQMVVRVIDDATSWDSDRHHPGLIPGVDPLVWSLSLIPIDGYESCWWCYLMGQSYSTEHHGCLIPQYSWYIRILTSYTVVLVADLQEIGVGFLGIVKLQKKMGTSQMM